MEGVDPIIDLAIQGTPVKPLDWVPCIPGSAECTFMGTTRPESHEHYGPLVALVYEAHESMALAEMTRLVEEAQEQWSPLAVRIHHAVGPVPVGSTSVVIQVVCRHRDESFAACRWLIDELKSRVPIWKQETWKNGSSWSAGTPLVNMAAGERS